MGHLFDCCGSSDLCPCFGDRPPGGQLRTFRPVGMGERTLASAGEISDDEVGHPTPQLKAARKVDIEGGSRVIASTKAAVL